MFEIRILQRDNLGNVLYTEDGVPKAKSFAADSGYKIWEFWNRNGTHLRKKAKAAKANEADSILADVNTNYAAKVQQKKRKVEEEDE